MTWSCSLKLQEAASDPDESSTWKLSHLLPMLAQPFNVLRYENGQHYDAHYDVFDPESYGPQTSQRVGTRQHAVSAYIAYSWHGMCSSALKC